MELKQIAELLAPFLDGASLEDGQLRSISIYINLLLRWNARINLTAVRDPAEIVTRHFGESLFAARHLFPDIQPTAARVIDIGSGAGFPGLPIKILRPEIHLTLIESNQKKAVFLRELVRALALADVAVYCSRAETFSGQADVVTLRAVERFESILPIGVGRVAVGGRLALLIGEKQTTLARQLVPSLTWLTLLLVPNSDNRVLLIGSKLTNPTRQEPKS